MKWSARIASVLLALTIGVVEEACSDSQQRAPLDTTGVSGTPPRGGSRGACAIEGAMQSCGVELGTRDGITDCAVGVQICNHGTWGVCEVDATRGQFHVPTPVSQEASIQDGSVVITGQLHTRALAADATTCNDPCDPYCQNFIDVPDAALTGAIVTQDAGYQTISVPIEQAGYPGGFVSKGEDPGNWCGRAAVGSVNWQAACQYDEYCDMTVPAGSSADHCKPFQPFQHGAPSTCTGAPDITSPPTCTTAAGDKVSVCNRGDVTAAAGIQCFAYSGNSTGPDHPYANANPGTGTLVAETTTALDPGECETIVVTANISNGTHDVMCNVPNATTVTTADGPRYA
jgi:hypothetical protein